MTTKSQEQNQKELEALESLEPSTGLGTVNKDEILKPKGAPDARLSFLSHIEIEKSNMNYGAMFYPENWIFKARAATGEEVVALSTINAEDPLSVDEGINEVLFACLRIEDKKTKKIIDVENIYEFDRLWFLLFIRDLTMQNKENDISWKVGCHHCEVKEMEIKLSFDSLVARPLSEIAKKYFNPSTQSFEVRTKSFGILKFQPTTIKRAKIYKDYLMSCAEKRINPDKKFMSMFPILINSDNENATDPEITLYTEYRRVIADLNLYSLYKNLQTELHVGIAESIKHTCEKCRKEGSYEITFPNGLHNIFVISDINSELL